MKTKERFDLCLYGIGEDLRKSLINIPETVKSNVQEIRLRVGLPVALTVAGDVVYVRDDGSVCFYLNESLRRVKPSDLEETYRLLCGNSVYAHTEELKNGFIIMKNGCRAGVCGTLSENGFMSNITSVNIRIAREIFGAANDIINGYEGGGLLIAGPPGSGKTTVLRDLIRQLSNGSMGKYMRTAVIDSRCEIGGSGTNFGIQNDLGSNTDVLVTADKAAGIEIALRTMFPDIIAFDEIGNSKELLAVKESFNSGVSVITTAHIGSVEELLQRPVTAELIKSGAVNQIAVLSQLHGSAITLIKTEDLSFATA